MIGFLLKNHRFANHVQTMIQVFYPNLQYKEVETPMEQGITITSILEGEGGSAILFIDGKEKSRYTFSDTKNWPKQEPHWVKAAIYYLLLKETGIHPKWGMLVGIRPAKVARERLESGETPEQVLTFFQEYFDIALEKAKLALQVAQKEQVLLAENTQKDCSIYVGIPFCPSRCLYCSFTSYSLQQYGHLVEGYLDALEKEITYLGEYAKGYSVKSIYIGGGTPTSLTAYQLERLLEKVEGAFSPRGIEYTVEAGRPDTISKEKLSIMKNWGVNRISINPQTMNEPTLKKIGRHHTVADIERVFYEAREIGHDHINMDLILGLPEEGISEVTHTMERIERLAPDAITVHTLAVKRASLLKESLDQYTMTAVEEMEAMLAISREYAKNMGMEPYYLYRQKNMIGNFENVGYALPQKEGVYNVQIMEERQTILAAGAGASTKLVNLSTNHIERIFNVKSVTDYVSRIDEMIERKRLGLPG